MRRIKLEFEVEFDSNQPPAKRRKKLKRNKNNSNRTNSPTNDDWNASSAKKNVIISYRTQANKKKTHETVDAFFAKSGFKAYYAPNKCDAFIDITAEYLTIDHVTFGENMQHIHLFDIDHDTREKEIACMDVMDEACFVAVTKHFLLSTFDVYEL